MQYFVQISKIFSSIGTHKLVIPIGEKKTFKHLYEEYILVWASSVKDVWFNLTRMLFCDVRPDSL